MSLFCAQGVPDREISSDELKNLFFSALEKLGKRSNVLAIPPDHTRAASRAGELTRHTWQYYGQSLRTILPAVGTHRAMSADQLSSMFGETPLSLFKVHKWRDDVETIGVVPKEFIREQSEGKLEYDWPAQVNRLVTRGQFDLILSIGQVVPHEVIGMANYNKNILIGTGGPESINRSHYLAAVYGMERIMGRADNPVRRVLNYAASHFLGHLPIVYVLTVVSRNSAGDTVVRGLFIGDDEECFLRAAELSLKVNFDILPKPMRKAVVYLDPHEFHSTWLGNKAVYRTRMALENGGELIILAPGVREFGEDPQIDKLIRKYGYHGTEATLEMVSKNEDLAANLGAAAHLIHGSSEGRFRITWCPGHLTREEVEGAGFGYSELNKMMQLYDPAKLKQGWNCVQGEDIFFIENPGLGLWATQDRF
ncbi:MAG TPA: lactate racemase domain-containing protein [Candidatus Dormibacteraeota bacterium]|jgi:nickel-dependent lactate racemase|nr:lactate racemase domain-containing protein [Candidatus Dormibacteraeota bacterium]